MLEVACLVFAFIVLMRILCVYRCSMWIIWKRFDLYPKLPSYNAMMINPIHWKRWTGKQWEVWLLKEESNA